MKRNRLRRFRHENPARFISSLVLVGFLGLLGAISTPMSGQAPTQSDPEKQVELLTQTMTRTQVQLEESQHQLEEMRRQIAELKQQIADARAEANASSTARQLTKQVDEIREEQVMQQVQIAAHDQSKVETESKYPVKITGLLLLNGFVNTRKVDIAATPTVALPGSGNTGATVKQTILGIDARGPHILGAGSHADVRVDFDGSSSPSGASGGGYNGDLVRLRTAHAALDWDHTELFFSYDHPIVSPYTPDSLAAVSTPAMAWSGNLWTWNPQIGVTQDIGLPAREKLQVQLALIDVQDPPALYTSSAISTPVTNTLPGTAEQSRWPGVEARVALLEAGMKKAAQFGVGGFYSPHSAYGTRWNAWAATLDYRQPLPARLEFSGSFYRGQSLGGLGGGAFKDYLFQSTASIPGESYFQVLDDVGGWAQLKQRASQRLEFNAAFGVDNVPAGQLRPFAGTPTAIYQNLARNRSFTGNVIFSPSAYTLFSLEYRRLASSPVIGQTAPVDIIGFAAGYKF